MPPHFVFQTHAVTTSRQQLTVFLGNFAINILHTHPKTVARHFQTAAIFDVVAAWKIEFFVVQPPRRIDVHTAYAVFIEPFSIQ